MAFRVVPALCKWPQHFGLPHSHFLEQRGLPYQIWKRRGRAFIWPQNFAQKIARSRLKLTSDILSRPALYNGESWVVTVRVWYCHLWWISAKIQLSRAMQMLLMMSNLIPLRGPTPCCSENFKLEGQISPLRHQFAPCLLPLRPKRCHFLIALRKERCNWISKTGLKKGAWCTMHDLLWSTSSLTFVGLRENVIF